MADQHRRLTLRAIEALQLRLDELRAGALVCTRIEERDDDVATLALSFAAGSEPPEQIDETAAQDAPAAPPAACSNCGGFQMVDAGGRADVVDGARVVIPTLLCVACGATSDA